MSGCNARLLEFLEDCHGGQSIFINGLATKMMSGITKCTSITRPRGVVSTKADWVIIEEDVSLRHKEQHLENNIKNFCYDFGAHEQAATEGAERPHMLVSHKTTMSHQCDAIV